MRKKLGNNEEKPSQEVLSTIKGIKHGIKIYTIDVAINYNSFAAMEKTTLIGTVVFECVKHAFLIHYTCPGN